MTKQYNAPEVADFVDLEDHKTQRLSHLDDASSYLVSPKSMSKPSPDAYDASAVSDGDFQESSKRKRREQSDEPAAKAALPPSSPSHDASEDNWQHATSAATHQEVRESKKPRTANSGYTGMNRWQTDATKRKSTYDSNSRPGPSRQTSTSSTASSVNPIYDERPLSSGEIRLLVLHHGPTNSSLDCSLIVRKEHQPYEALSYVWGNEAPTESIRIRRGQEGSDTMKVTAPLLNALHRLRYEDRPRYFWIDAICINQESHMERNHQVPLMAKIYHEATRVCVWLGDADDDTELVLPLIESIRILKRFNHIVEKSTTCEQWVALTNLMKRRWFSRRWVVQEIALAREAILQCGSFEIPWPLFSDSVALFQHLADRVRAKFRESKEHGNDPDFIGEIASMSASKLVSAVSEFVRISRPLNVPLQEKVEKLHNLEYLVSSMTMFEASLPHDTIYAVLSLANDVTGSSAAAVPRDNTALPVPGTPSNETYAARPHVDPKKRAIIEKAVRAMRAVKYPVDYKSDFAVACIEFLKFATNKSHSIDIICRPWAPAKAHKLTLPSFILSSQHAAYSIRSDHFADRSNADTLVGMPGKHLYTASEKYLGKWIFSHEGSQPVLTVDGFVLDVIDDVLDAANGGVIPDEWPSFAGWNDLEEPPPDEYWQTIVGGRDEEGRTAPLFYKTACQQTYGEGVPYSEMATATLRTRLGSDMLERYLKRIQAVVWGRRMARSKDHGILCLTPSKPVRTKSGDLLCILGGCSVPVVLRRLEEQDCRTGDKKKHYQFIGECYAHGMMMGEAFQVKNDNNYSFMKFNIK